MGSSTPRCHTSHHTQHAPSPGHTCTFNFRVAFFVNAQDTAKALAHHAKYRATCITSGDPRVVQVPALKSDVDLVVATPGRLLRYFKQGALLSRVVPTRHLHAWCRCSRCGGCSRARLVNDISNNTLKPALSSPTPVDPCPIVLLAGDVLLSDVRYVVLDEADTLLCDNFVDDIKQLLVPLRVRRVRHCARLSHKRDRALQSETCCGTSLLPLSRRQAAASNDDEDRKVQFVLSAATNSRPLVNIAKSLFPVRRDTPCDRAVGMLQHVAACCPARNAHLGLSWTSLLCLRCGWCCRELVVHLLWHLGLTHISLRAPLWSHSCL